MVVVLPLQPLRQVYKIVEMLEHLMMLIILLLTFLDFRQVCFKLTNLEKFLELQLNWILNYDLQKT